LKSLDSKTANEVLQSFLEVVENMYSIGVVSDLYFYVVVVDPAVRFGEDAFGELVLAMGGLGDVPRTFINSGVERAKTALYLKGVKEDNPHMKMQLFATGISFLHGVPIGVGGIMDLECQMLAELLGNMLVLAVDRKHRAERGE